MCSAETRDFRRVGMGINGEFERDGEVANGDDILRELVLFLGEVLTTRVDGLEDLLGVDGGVLEIRDSATLNVVGGVHGLAVTYRRR